MSESTSAYIDVWVGGGLQAGIGASPAAAKLVIDAQEEIARVPDAPGLFRVPLGQHDTVRTLLDRVATRHPEAASLSEELRDRPNAHLSTGMACNEGIGRYAVVDLLDRGLLSAVFDEILIAVMEKCNGVPPLIIVRDFASIAGGTGAGGGVIASGALCDFLEERTSAKLRLLTVRLGAQTFLPIAPGARRNACRSLLRSLDVALARHGSARRVAALELIELPLAAIDGRPLRDNREVRDLLASSVLQARLTSELDHIVAGREINQALFSPLGNVLRVKAQWSSPIDGDNLIRASATSYRSDLRAFRAEPALEGTPDTLTIEFEQELASSPLPQAETILESIRNSGDLPDVLLKHLANPGEILFKTAVLMRAGDSGSTSVPQMLADLHRPTALEHLRRDRNRLHRAIVLFESTAVALESERLQAAETLVRCRLSLIRLVRRWTGLHRTIDDAIHGATGVLRRFDRAYRSYRMTLESHSAAIARLACATQAARIVRQALEEYEEMWLGRLEKALDCVLEGRLLQSRAFKLASLAEAYPLLLAACPSSISSGPGRSAELQPLQKCLEHRMLRQVTRFGLGEMLDVASDPPSIAAALVGDGYVWASPSWGGAPDTCAPRHRFVVIPPVSPGDLRDLREALADREPLTPLLCAETVAGGLCAVLLEFYPVESRGSVIPSLYGASASDEGV